MKTINQLIKKITRKKISHIPFFIVNLMKNQNLK